MTLHYPALRVFKWLRAGLDWGKYHADLGETLDESISRFGPVTHIGDIRSFYPQHEFDRDGLEVSIAYEDGRAIRVWYSSERAISEEVIEQGLAAYGLGQDWRIMDDVPSKVTGLFSIGGSQPGRHFERADQEAWACVGGRGRDLHQRTFHFEVSCGRWARVSPTRYGIWTVNGRPKTDQVGARNR